MLTICSIGIPRNCETGRRGARLVLDRILGETIDGQFRRRLAGCDRCIVGMMLQIAVCFGIEDERSEAIVGNLLTDRMPDGAWNCCRTRRPRTHHSSFHTTFNVLEGFREYLERGNGTRLDNVRVAEQSALEPLLQHRLFKSDRTGEVINQEFTMLSFPYRWHYDVLRGLEYIARTGAPREDRLLDAIDLLQLRLRADGCWPVQNKYAGKVFFELEKVGGPSRWNTLRALRVLRWRDAS